MPFKMISCKKSYYNEKKIFNQILIIYIVYQYVYTHYLLLVQLFLSLSCNVSVYVLSVSVIEKKLETYKIMKKKIYNNSNREVILSLKSVYKIIFPIFK